MATELKTLVELDFLPASYCRRRMLRRAYAWRFVAALGMCGFLGATSLWLNKHHEGVLAKLAAVESQFADAAEKEARLAEVTGELQAELKTAELLTYLRHRWPRSRIVDAILEPLPDNVILTELKIGHEPIQAAETSTITLLETESEPVDRPSRRSADLKRLLQESSRQQHFVMLTGQSTDAATLHEYLARLGTNPLFSSVDLGLLENAPNASGASGAMTPTRFTARAKVCPGHGQIISAPQSTEPLAQRGE